MNISGQNNVLGGLGPFTNATTPKNFPLMSFVNSGKQFEPAMTQFAGIYESRDPGVRYKRSGRKHCSNSVKSQEYPITEFQVRRLAL